jgi:hypothetical protein
MSAIVRHVIGLALAAPSRGPVKTPVRAPRPA